MLKFTSELTLRCEDWYIQKGRNHHVTTLIALKSSQMSIIFMIVQFFYYGKIFFGVISHLQRDFFPILTFAIID